MIKQEQNRLRCRELSKIEREINRQLASHLDL